MDKRTLVFKERAGKPGGGKGILINEKDAAFTLSTHPDETVVIALQANGIDRADTAGCNGCGWNAGGVSYTLNTIDRHAVCYRKFRNDEQSEEL